MENLEKKVVKKGVKYAIAAILILIITSTCIRWCTKVVNPERAINTYEHFYVLYDQAEQICNDIIVMQGADSITGGFSRNERIIGLENKMNDVIKDYNAQSKAWTKSMWKADDLPYLLKRSDFNCKQ